jgi:hypothetical protein
MQKSQTISQEVYQAISVSNALALPRARVNHRLQPQLLSGAGSSDSFYTDDLTMEGALPRLQLSPEPTNVVFENTAVGSSADVTLQARNYQSQENTVLYGAMITNVVDLTNAAWNATAWKIIYDPSGVFQIVSGAQLTATSGVSGWQDCVIRFCPSTVGTYTGVVRVATTDPNDWYSTNAWYSGGGLIHGSIVFEDYDLVGTAFEFRPTGSMFSFR